MKILVIGEEIACYKHYRVDMERANVAVETLTSLEEDRGIRLSQYDFIIAVVTSHSGSKVLEQIKLLNEITDVPIIVLYEDLKKWTRIELIESGAAACFALPMTVQELIAQLDALHHNIKRRVEELEDIVFFGSSLAVDRLRKLAYVMGKRVRLTRKEFLLLDTLVSNANHVISKKDLYKAAWSGPEDYWSEDAVKSCIRSLRKKLGESAQKYIQNVRGDGYLFSVEKK